MDEDFFESWSPVMAYVLGFWFADGYMRKEKSYRVTFTSQDKESLIKIRGALGSNHPITPYSKSKENKCYFISFCSKKLYNDLLSLGGVRGKSKIIEFPNVPKSFLPDFIRGYFDGDGSVFFVKYKRSKDGKITKELRTNFTSGSHSFISSLMRLLEKELGLAPKKLGVYNDGGSLKLGYGMRDSDVLLRYIYYEGFPIGLGRKAAFVKQIPEYKRHRY